MSYIPTQWSAGDTVTSAKLNKLEQGVANGGGIMIVHSDENGVLDKTWQEIYNEGFGVVMEEMPDGLIYELIIQIINVNNSFTVITLGLGSGKVQSFLYETQSSDDYPVFQPTQK